MKKADRNPVDPLAKPVRLSINTNIQDVAESLAAYLNTPDKLTAFLKLLDQQYADFEWTMRAASWYVGEVRQDYLANKEPFDINEVFADVLKA